MRAGSREVRMLSRRLRARIGQQKEKSGWGERAAAGMTINLPDYGISSTSRLCSAVPVFLPKAEILDMLHEQTRHFLDLGCRLRSV
jgi:hypothetical protein